MERLLRRLRLALVIAGLVASPRMTRADDGTSRDLAAARRALIALRVLAYDKQIAKRAPGAEIVVAVIATGAKLSRDEQTSWLAGFKRIPKVKVDGRPVRVVAVDFRTAKQVAADLGRLGAAAAIVTGELDTARPAIRTATRAHQVLSFSTREADLHGGIAVGLIANEEHTEVAIGLEAARAEGVRFGAGLLQLARLVDEDAP